MFILSDSRLKSNVWSDLLSCLLVLWLAGSRFNIFTFEGRNQIHHRDILIQMQLNNDWCMKKTKTTTSQFTNKPVNSTMKKNTNREISNVFQLWQEVVRSCSIL